MIEFRRLGTPSTHCRCHRPTNTRRTRRRRPWKSPPFPSARMAVCRFGLRRKGGHGRSSSGCMKAGCRGKFLEAPHLKAVGTVMRVAGIESRRTIVQVARVGSADSGRPTHPIVADIPQSATGAVDAWVAEARGGNRAQPGSCCGRSFRLKQRVAVAPVVLITNAGPIGRLSGPLNLPFALPEPFCRRRHSGTQHP